MAETGKRPPERDGKKKDPKDLTREEKLAQALRDNLRRRKAKKD